ncbi:TadE/TadG family type IV pilus assembly protein [Methylobacterium sp. J-068]|uniref:TadE/TadG family type IV pilus assembly protein n=1 Tax=Methylobacterium sp. J-068 TaxID=2836649 RepID=UPI001FB91B46|nr:TadE/TadG family type IV pilus assembly protein [Methylobacterium sp. J-068]MCJ2032951.1 pilus assembly protein [Methylobacterium sp. J-068]
MLGRFRSDRSGATAVEFGLVALPFFTLLAAIIEIAFRIWAAQNLDYALQKASRSLFTGAFQVANSGQSDPSVLLGRLKTNVCNAGTLMGVFDCQSIKIDVTLSTSYAGGSVPSPLDSSSGDWASNAGTQYSCPQPGSIVIVSAAVKFPAFFTFLKLNPNTFADGSQLLQSTAVFRTEPYQTTSSTGCGT